MKYRTHKHGVPVHGLDGVARGALAGELDEGEAGLGRVARTVDPDDVTERQEAGGFCWTCSMAACRRRSHPLYMDANQ